MFLPNHQTQTQEQRLHTGTQTQARDQQQRVAFRTIGCRLNQCETAQMEQAIESAGYRLVDWNQSADVRVINTCTVTAKSDRTCRREIRMAKRLDPGCLVVVTGCYAQVNPDAVAAIPGVDLVLGNLDKRDLAKYLAEWVESGRGRGRPEPAAAPTQAAAHASLSPTVAVSSYAEHPAFDTEVLTHFHGYTRAFLKIQTGCDSACAYCIIPVARGPARSMPRAQVLRQVQSLTARDYREVVLTGIDLGSWGRDSGEGSLADLLALLLERGGAGRYRLSSIEPLEMDEALQDVIAGAGNRVAHHFHLPLQSGSDSVLERMGRPYSAAEYLDVIDQLVLRFPDAAVGADVIVGFPGETDKEFKETLSFIERAPLTYLHVFSYSDRPGTRASSMRPKVHPDIIHDRSRRLRALGERKKKEFQERIAQTQQRALILKEPSTETGLVGLTGNYQEVLVTNGHTDHGLDLGCFGTADKPTDLVNRFATVQLGHLLADGRWVAEIVQVERDT